jgi:hypothetical protein
VRVARQGSRDALVLLGSSQQLGLAVRSVDPLLAIDHTAAITKAEVDVRRLLGPSLDCAHELDAAELVSVDEELVAYF